MGRRKRVSIFVLIDALGWEFLKDREFLPGILKYRRRVPTILGFSSGVIPSILTGTKPQVHGHWNLFYLNPEGSPFKWTRPMAVLPKGVINARVIRKGIHLISRKVSRYGGYFHIYGVPSEFLHFFDICEKRDIYSPGGINGTRSIFDLFMEMEVDYRSFSYHQYSDADIFKAVKEDIATHARRCYFLYLCELDSVLHRHCADEAFVERSIAWYEKEIEALFEAARARYGDVELYVFSDHGMTRTTGTYDLKGEIDVLGFAVPKDYLVLYDSTMARLWFFSDDARESITGRLKELDCGHILDDGELKDLGVYFPDRRFGEVIFLMKPGCLINPSHMGNKAPSGMHGFHPDDDASHASLLATNDCGEVEDVTGFFTLMQNAVD